MTIYSAGFGAKHRIPNKHSKVFAPSGWKWLLLQMLQNLLVSGKPDTGE
jgi:hypothetical protein